MRTVSTLVKPTARPNNPRFSSGPCTKHPGWSVDRLEGALVGRYHRGPETKARLALAIERTAALLELPADYRVAIVPASDTGAVEMALWSLLGPRGVDVLAWEAFSRDWVTDIVEQLKVQNVRASLRLTASCPISAKSIATATWCSPGTAPRPACASPMPIGSGAIVRA